MPRLVSWQGRHKLVRRVVLVTAAFVCVVAPAAQAADPPPGADWTTANFPSADGKANLHADVFRPQGLPASAKTPVILSIGPYFNHTGQLGPAGVVEDAPYDPIGGGPSDRFYDFINGAKVFERGYSWVQVDLRGFGGSSGCLDWGGPGEQADVKAAVEWAASQPWSTGRVGMYGKSYDGVTGMLGIVQQPRGLAAVVSQEPVYDLYRYLYMNRVRFINSLLTPGLYDAIAASPGGPADDPLAYNFESINDLARPGCPALNYADQQDPNHDSAYWRQRDLITLARGKRTPFFLTQGFIENNTKPDGAFDFYNGMTGPKRAWLGQWDHVRGNDRVDGRLAMGREGWFAETMRFYDRYVAGKSAADAPVENDPPNAVESNDGKWRSEAAWPPSDSFDATAKLRPDTYVDDAQNNGTAESGGPNGQGIWTFSPVLEEQTRFAGVPRLTVDVGVPGPNANLTAAIYDVGVRNDATLISRGTYLLPGSGKVSFDLYGNDWKLPPGHRFGVLISSSHAEWWQHVPTGQTVTVKSASVTMPYLGCRRDQTIQGGQSIKLENYLKTAPFTVDAATIREGTDPAFPLPGAAAECSAAELAGGPATVPASEGGGAGGSQGSPAGCVDRRKFKFRIHQPTRGRIVKAVAYVNGKRKASKKGRRITSITVKKLPQQVFTVKIVATASNGARTISVRRYRGCKKGRPSTTVRPPRGHR
ncbi:MAG: uncharacterized protein QOI64_1925 [Solirubrobacteraceae bacterium]|nr:uncharacterized protein [Solirubrobacteraceae bacterium]